MKELLPVLQLVKHSRDALNLTLEQITSVETTAWEDNVGALTLANLEPGQTTPRTKHYAVKLHWFRSKLKPNRITVIKIDTTLQ